MAVFVGLVGKSFKKLRSPVRTLYIYHSSANLKAKKLVEIEKLKKITEEIGVLDLTPEDLVP